MASRHGWRIEEDGQLFVQESDSFDAVWASPEVVISSDFDGDGIDDMLLETGVDYSGIDSIFGDINDDGAVGFADFLILSNNYLEVGEGLASDLDNDGIVGFSDFLLLASVFA